MPATSKKQFRLFKGIAEGTIPEKDTLTKEKAAEMINNQSPDNLPEKAAGNALNRLVGRVKRAGTKQRFRIG